MENTNAKTNVQLSKRYIRLRMLIVSAIMVALGSVLSLIKLFEMPLGGSVTLLSMLPILFVGFAFGPKWGFGAAFVYSLFQLFTSSVFSWGLTPLVLVVCILADYIVAFTLLGISGFFKGKGMKGIVVGTVIALAARLACHYISGVTIWASSAPEGWNPWIYSIAYNGAFMLPELIFTLIGVVIVFSVPQIKRLMTKYEA